MHGPEWIPVIILAAFGWLVAFVAWWALAGWGFSIAVRVYRRSMRAHQHNRELAQLGRGLAGRPADQQVDELAGRG